MATRTEVVWMRACAAAIAELPDLTPARLNALLMDVSPDQLWNRLGEGMAAPLALHEMCPNVDKLMQRWRAHVRRIDPSEVLERYDDAGVGVLTPCDEYPGKLTTDLHAPSVLFYKGNRRLLDAPTVGIVGTRRATPEGLLNARRFGAELAEAGVAVVSGLALGIDAAAHEGALSVRVGVPPVGVVGSGLDVVYPKRNKALWQQVADEGVLLSEATLGSSPEAWRFPARNRIIAGLSDVLLVVESNKHGGSLITAHQALDRGVPVLAVPGSIRSRASVGTNELLRDGATPACSTDDVLELLALEQPNHVLVPLLLPVESDLVVLEAVERYPTTTDEVIMRTGGSLGEVAASLLRLQDSGWIVGIDGWWQRVNDETAGDG